MSKNTIESTPFDTFAEVSAAIEKLQNRTANESVSRAIFGAPCEEIVADIETLRSCLTSDVVPQELKDDFKSVCQTFLARMEILEGQHADSIEVIGFASGEYGGSIRFLRHYVSQTRASLSQEVPLS